MRTSQATLSPKFLECDSATGTNALIEFVQIFGDLGFRLDTWGHFVRIDGGRLAQIFLRARFAQVQSLNFTVPKFGDVQYGGFRAATALFHETLPTGSARPGMIFREETATARTLEVSAALRSRSNSTGRILASTRGVSRQRTKLNCLHRTLPPRPMSTVRCDS